MKLRPRLCTKSYPQSWLLLLLISFFSWAWPKSLLIWLLYYSILKFIFAYLLFLCWDFVISRVFAISYWSIIIMEAWKFLFNNSNILDILILVPINCLFLFSVLNIANNFLFYPWLFLYCVISHWIYLNLLFYQTSAITRLLGLKVLFLPVAGCLGSPSQFC